MSREQRRVDSGSSGVARRGVGVTDNKFMIFIMTGLLENGNCSIYLSVSIVLINNLNRIPFFHGLFVDK